MILYLIIILVSQATIVLFNLLYGSLGFWQIYWHTLFNIGIVFVIDAIIAFLVRLIPEQKINPFSKFFLISDKQKRLYKFFGVRKWKDKIPESGKYLCNFAKDKISEPNNNLYVKKFLIETCYAEIMHIICVFVTYLPILFMPYKLSIVLPVAFVNSFLQLLPVIVQRYNRIRLIRLYNYNIRHQNGEENGK